MAARIHTELFDHPDVANRAMLSCSQLLLAESKDGKRTAPEWLPLLPSGDVVLARDGRSFRNDHTAVMAAFLANRMALPIDWDHALDKWDMEPGGGRAAAWIDQLEVRDGGLWGHVEVWTARGRESVESLEYRYISPVIFFDDNRKLISVPRASLVNNPALIMPALCRQENSSPMDPELLKALLAGLSIDPKTASKADIDAAVERFRGKVNAPLETHIPREQYDRVTGELAAVKVALASLEGDAKKTRIDSIITEALNAGRMIPSEREFFTAMAAKDGGAADVEKFLASRAVFAGSAPKAPSAGGHGNAEHFGLSDAERAVCDRGGITYKAYAEQKKRIQG